MCHYFVSIEFDDGQISTTKHTSARDVRDKLAELINDLTDQDSMEHFRSVTVTQSAA